MDISTPMPGQQLPPDAQDQTVRQAQEDPVRKPRTRQAAEKAYRLSRVPDYLALPMPGLLAHSLSFTENQFAYLQTIRPSVMEHISFRDGATYLDYSVADYVRLHLFYENDPKVISNIDTILLRVLYSIVLEAQIPLATSREGILEILLRPRDIDRTFTLYIPDIAQMTNYGHVSDYMLQVLFHLTIQQHLPRTESTTNCHRSRTTAQPPLCTIIQCRLSDSKPKSERKKWN